MAPVLTKETCVQKYEECKISKNGRTPEYAEFLKEMNRVTRCRSHIQRDAGTNVIMAFSQMVETKSRT